MQLLLFVFVGMLPFGALSFRVGNLTAVGLPCCEEAQVMRSGQQPQVRSQPTAVIHR